MLIHMGTSTRFRIEMGCILTLLTGCDYVIYGIILANSALFAKVSAFRMKRILYSITHAFRIF